MKISEEDKNSQEIDLKTERCDINAVGTWLKGAREAKGETLDNISRVTRIGKNYLEAIENGHFSKLPSSAYTRGFIRLYATHLGLSSDEALLLLEHNQSALSTNNSSAETASTTNSPLKSIKSRLSPKRKWLSLLIIISSSIAAALLLFSPSRKLISPEIPAPATLTAPLPSENIQKNPSRTSVDMNASAPSADKINEMPVADGIVLRLKAVRDGKLHITIDGAISQEYDLVVGDLVEWKAEKVFLLDVENAAAVEGELNGVPLKSFGEQGKPAHMNISANGVHNE